MTGCLKVNIQHTQKITPKTEKGANMAAHDKAFDKIMEMAGDEGPFQKRFNYIFNAGLVFFGSMIYMNIILALNVPEHWCHVPGREHTNFTNEQWKHLTLPRLIFYLFTYFFFYYNNMLPRRNKVREIFFFLLIFV